MRDIASLYSLNRGIISRLGAARVDVKRIALAAARQNNWMPRVLGSMMVRAGLGYLGTVYNSVPARFLKFIFATNDTALLELTDMKLRVWIQDALLTRPAVTTAITNGTFATDLTGWTDTDEAGATSTWASPGYMQMVGDGTARAIREQQVTVTGANIGVEHALRIVVARGPVYLRVGSTSGADDYVSETVLPTGTHSISFTPTGDFFVRFFSSQIPLVWVNECTLEAAGIVEIPTLWSQANLSNVRYKQSGDVVFSACEGLRQQRIERRGTRPNARSWSVCDYLSNDGPFKVENVTTVTLTPSALTGNITITSSKPMFKLTHVGALFSITSVGQAVTATASVSSVATASIRVTSILTARAFTIIISGDATGSTVDLQRSYDNSTWANVAGQQWTSNVTTSFNDGLDNQIVYYRLFLTTRVAPDSVTMQLSIGTGSVRGIARVTDFSTSLVVNAEVLSPMGGTTANTIWQEGQWSPANGYPTAVCFHEGRLWWSGKNGVWGSITDAFDSFDETFIGDAGPINRTIGSGPVDKINWLLSLQRLLIGAQGAEFGAKSSSLDEPLTPTNFNIKAASTQGSGAVEAIQVDQSGYFVNRSGVRIYDLSLSTPSFDYSSNDLTALVPDLGYPGIVRMDVQRQPDTRLHCVRSDGVVMVAVYSRTEDVLAWVTADTDGFVEDVVTLPALDGNEDDQVYYVVRRTINGATVRYLEKWAQERECWGDQALCMLGDSYITYSGIPTTTISAPHLALKEVVVWADGRDVGTDDSTEVWTQRYTADAAGLVTLDTAASDIMVGLGYMSQFQSAKLGEVSKLYGSPLNREKKVGRIGLIMADLHPKGIRFGPDFDNLDDMPEIEEGAPVGPGTILDYDKEMIEFPGQWTTNARICLQGQAPRPCTVLAVTPDMASYA